MTEAGKSNNRFRIYYEKLAELFQMKMVPGETINSFLAIRSISGGRIFQPDFSSNPPGSTSVYDEKLEGIFVMYRSD